MKIKILLFTLLFLSFNCISQIVGDYRSIGNVSFIAATNWQVCTSISPVTWVAATSAPTAVAAVNTITVQATHTATNSISGTTIIANIVVSGTLNVSANFTTGALTINGTAGIVNLQNGNTLTVNGNVTVNTGGEFDANFNPGTSSFLIVYGNYINNGTTDFWKATAIITGDLLSPSTSTLQNNGNVVVGGNIIGSFNTTGGDGSGQIYALNSNAIVEITPPSIDTNVTPGAPLNATDTAAIGALVNQVLYGTTCSFTINDVINVTTCIGGNAIFTVTTNASSPTFQWQVNTGSGGWVNLVNNTSYSGVFSATLIITNVTAGMIGYKYRARITGTGPTCTANGDYGTLISLTAPTVGTITQPVCNTPTGSVVLNGLPASGTWTLTRSPGNVTTTGTGVTSTISGFLSGTYTYTVTNSSGCVSTSSSNIVINAAVQSAPIVGTITHPTCTVSTGSIALSGLPAVGTWTLTRNPGNITSTGTGTTTTISGLASGTYSYVVTNSLSCLSPSSANIVINSQPVTPVQPTVSSVTQPTCTVSTGSFTISNYNASFTYAASPSIGVIITGSSITAPSGTYTVTATLGSCTSIPSASVSVISSTNTWNGTSWSKVTPPTSPDERIVFAGTYTSATDLIGCACQVNSGVVTISSGNTLTVTNEVTVNPGGTLTFLNNASLVQINDSATNSGNITYNRTTRPMTRFAYVYWGSPVEGNVFSQIPIQFDLGYRWQSGSVNGLWLPLSATTLGEGFITRVRNIAPFNTGSGTIDFAFTGKPNNGLININVDSYNTSVSLSGNTVLLANPYPSAIDAAKFLQDSNNNELGGTLYFWTAVTQYSGAGSYNVQDYGSWNSTGGTAPVNAPSLIPNGKIAAGQGFFAQVFSDGQISFNNFMRETGNNTQFFRSSTTTVTTEDDIEKNRIWLNLSGENRLRQTLLGYVTGATNSLDRLYDGDSFTSNEIDIYSVLDNRNLVIQGRSLPFTETDIVPIGFRVTTAGNYSISLFNTDGIFAGNQNVYLFDKNIVLYHDLKIADYNFSTTNGTFNDRFEIRYTTQALGINSPIVSDNDIKVVANNQALTVYSSAIAITKIQVFDVLGKLLFSQDDLNTNVFETTQLQNTTQLLLVKVTLDNGQTHTKKTLIH
jgi:hypothetical protein